MIVRWTVLAFSFVLLVAGVSPLVNPNPGPTSTAPAYAFFHLGAALVGLAAFAIAKGRFAPVFAGMFGLVDLYQALASAFGWFPKDQFQWTQVDDGLHWSLGLVLVLLGVVGWIFRPRIL